MDKFEQKEIKKVRPIKNTWYDRLMNCFPEPKVISLFKTNARK